MTRNTKRWLYPLFVLIGGCICVAVTYKLQWFSSHPGFAYFAQHLGVGAIVAAIVGWGYEVQTRENEIANLIQQWFDVRHREAIAAYKDVIVDLFTTKDKRYSKLHDSLTQNLIQLIDSVNNLESSNFAANTVSVGIVVRLLEYSSLAAHALNVSAGDVRPIELPRSAATLADEILAKEMAEMKTNDSYIVISDFASWHPNRLSLFWRASEAAMKGSQHIRIRRVFCRFLGDGNLTKVEAEAVLAFHWLKAHELGLYKNKPLYDVAVCLHTTAGHPHLGIFKSKRQTICFAPMEGSDLSVLNFSRRDETSRFDACWNDAIPAYRATPKGTYDLVGFDALKDIIANDEPEWWHGFR